MQILMVAPEPFFEPRGTPISVYQRLRALSALGHQIDLATYHVGADVQIPGVRICRIPRVPFIHQVKVGPSWVKPILDILLFVKVLFLLLRHRYDVIHSHEEASFFVMILARLFRVRHVYDMHSSLPLQLKSFAVGNHQLLIWLFTWFERQVLYTSDMVLTIDEDLEKLVRHTNPLVRQYRIENMAVHSGYRSSPINLDPVVVTASQEKSPLVVYTGTFERYQGLNILFAAATRVWEHHPDVQFVLVGGKPHQVSHWQETIRDLTQAHNCHFVGIVSPEEALAYLDIADVLVSPRLDGTSVPLKIYSYLRAGKPIVATRLPAHERVLSDENAYLVEPTEEALAEGILAILRDPDLGQRLGQQAQQLAREQYSNDNYQQKMREAYQSLMTTTPRPQTAPHLGETTSPSPEQ